MAFFIVDKKAFDHSLKNVEKREEQERHKYSGIPTEVIARALVGVSP